MKFLLWNLENFFLINHIKSSYNQPLKPQKKVTEIISLLDDIAADVMFFCEMGGQDSLASLAKTLKGEFQYFYTEGNSDRGIGLGFLVRKNFSKVKFHRHADQPLPAISLEDKKSPRKFSRDVAELWLCDDNMKPQLIIWGVHLKSGQDRSGGDFRGIRQRSAEVRGLVALMKSRQISYPDIPQWVAGDFNGKAYGPHKDQEFEHFAAQMPQHHDLLERLDTPVDQRWSFATAFSNDGVKGIPAQLDYLFVPDQTPTPQASDSGLIQLWQRLGINAGWAHGPAQRELWPSDHLPILATWPQRPF